MRWQLELLSGPEIEPVSLAEMKLHLREYSATDRDAEITEITKAAREWVEDYTGQVLMDQTWRLSIDQKDTWLDANAQNTGFIDSSVSVVYLRRTPILEVISVETVDSDGVGTAVDASQYQLRPFVDDDRPVGKWPYLVPTSSATWQESNLRITFRAGYADLTSSPQDDSSVVPARFKQAIKLWASGVYDKDEVSAEAAIALAKTLKVQVGFA